MWEKRAGLVGNGTDKQEKSDSSRKSEKGLKGQDGEREDYHGNEDQKYLDYISSWDNELTHHSETRPVLHDEYGHIEHRERKES